MSGLFSWLLAGCEEVDLRARHSLEKPYFVMASLHQAIFGRPHGPEVRCRVSVPLARRSGTARARPGRQGTGHACSVTKTTLLLDSYAQLAGSDR